jgi:hypothetical protein
MSEEISVLGYYETVREEIVQPLRMTGESRYFLMKWEPALGVRAARIVRVLRSLGYVDHAAKIERGGIAIDLPGLANLCGFSVPTVKREFASNPHLHKFVQREKNYKTHPITGQIWREENIYRVRMTDPVHPDDEPLQRQMAEDREKNARNEKSPRKAQNEPNGEKGTPARKAHFDSVGSQNEPGGDQNEPAQVQNDSRLNQNELTLKTPTLNSPEMPLDTLNTPAADPEILASLFGRECGPRDFSAEMTAAEQKTLSAFSAQEWTALEAEARARVIDENADPVRELAQKGKAFERVRTMARQILRERG